jgi:hypothetical protein
MKMTQAIRRILFLIIFLIPVFTYAQPGPPAGGSPPCGEPFGPPCPIDGGVSLLIAAGLAFGGKKAYDANRNKA